VNRCLQTPEVLQSESRQPGVWRLNGKKTSIRKLVIDSNDAGSRRQKLHILKRVNQVSGGSLMCLYEICKCIRTVGAMGLWR
jgi:hypothetical protein